MLDTLLLTRSQYDNIDSLGQQDDPNGTRALVVFRQNGMSLMGVMENKLTIHTRFSHANIFVSI